MSRFVIGIDLGTTNTAIAFVDTEVMPENPEEAMVTTLPIEQVVDAGSVDARPTLPSALYVARGNELPAGSLNLPWRAEEKFVVGAFAREQGAKIPTRYIHSAKSWLSYDGIDRTAPLLPPNTPEKDAKISPVEVSQRLMEHLVDSWNNMMAVEDGSADLRQQEITLCVPASFDAEARQLTVQAAKNAGLQNLHLLEEPQAAFHSWIESIGPDWRKQVSVGDLVLVVDVGGGTTDFSLIAVMESAGELELRRVAVGEHILLGGDNMDLAIAYGVAQKLKSEKQIELTPWQMSALVNQCRAAKEALLADPEMKEHPITILGQGSSVIGGSIRTTLPREGLDQFLVDGFFPNCAIDDLPFQARRTGFREAGLPYAADAGITRHMAQFLSRHAEMVKESLPDATVSKGAVIPSAILFNGGVFRAEVLRHRIETVLASWSKEAGVDAPRTLIGTDLDLAVARGAAYLGLARRGKGVRIRGGSARSYYIGIEGAQPAVPGMPPPMKLMCVVPHGMEEGTSTEISGKAIDLCVWAGEPASFRFFSSTSRRQDKPGDLLDVNDEEFVENNPIDGVLGKEGEGRAVEVDLAAHLTEVGVLQLSCLERGTEEEYQLEFSTRHAEIEA